MKWTKSPRIAMERLAEVLGWTVTSTGRAWHITEPGCYHGLSYSAIGTLCVMTRVAMAPHKWKGGTMTGEDVRNLIRFRPVHMFDRKSYRHFLKLPANIAATDETTLYAAYFNPSDDEIDATT